MTAQASLRVDIVSDVVCPWCAVGYNQLARAAEARAVALELHWHPFELNPQMPEEGENLQEHLAAKYGTSAAESLAARDRLTALGAEVGFTFAFSDDMRMVNTFRAHQLIDWAAAQGRAHEVKLALFTAYFTRRADLADPQVLADVAAGLEFDRGAVLKMLEVGSHAATVREKEQFWTSRGVTGVPAMIFDKQHLVSGAQGVKTYGRILDHILSEQSA